jgi:hypothetical protein
MLGRLKKPVKPANGTNGSNGHEHADSDTNGHGSPAPRSEIEVAADYWWTLEVRQDSQLLGAMHSSNPFVLIDFFREYTVLFGAPVGNFAVWLRHRQSERGAPLLPLSGQAAWLEFLRGLDPQLDENLARMQASVDRTGMIDHAGRQTYPDAILEVAFGQN